MITTNDIKKFRAIHALHTNKLGRDYRLEILKLSKEEIYDFLEVKYEDYIEGWAMLLQDSKNECNALKRKITRLEEQLKTHTNEKQV